MRSVTELIGLLAAHAYTSPIYCLLSAVHIYGLSTVNTFTRHYTRRVSVLCPCLLAVELAKERDR